MKPLCSRTKAILRYSRSTNPRAGKAQAQMMLWCLSMMSCRKTLNFRITNHSFQCLDELLKQHNIKPLSLNPHRTLSTSFSALGNWIVQTTDDLQFIKVFRETLAGILQSILRNFPENIFWDFDYLVISMLRQALACWKGSWLLLKILRWENRVIDGFIWK
jgi:hypothetical protein